MTSVEYWNSDTELCDVVSRVVPAYKVSGVNWDHMTYDVLYCGLFIFIMINLFMFVGN